MNILKRIWAALVAWFTGFFDEAKAPAENPPTSPTEPEQPAEPDSPPTLSLGPDAEGRIRIPEVEALGGDWAHTWWFAPWVLRGPNDIDPVSVWQIRWACMCDEHGKVTLAAHRGYDTAEGAGRSPYCIWVPRKYHHGTDKYGRENIIFQAGDTDVQQPDGTWVAKRLHESEPVLMTDKLTRATIANNGAELAAYIQEHGIVPIPEPGDWDGGVGP